MDLRKEIKLGPEARKELMEGIDILADAVVCTLGPNGRNVLIENDQQSPLSTKDGVTVAKSIHVDGKIKDLGARVVRQAAMQTADKAGDGTTTSTLLAREMIKAGLQHINNGVNAVEVKRGIDAAVKQVVDCLREQIAEDISNEDQLEQIATISANNDFEVGKLIATAIEKVGRDGVVHIEESKSDETYLETVEGMQFDRGYKSPYFVTDNSTMTCTLNDPFILIADQRFTQVKDLLPILEHVSTTNKPLLIIAEDIDGEALATLVVNKARGIVKVCAVKAPDFGDRRKIILEDIATLTGGTVFDKDKGMKLDRFSWDWFGSARTVTISKEQTTIVDGKGNETSINNRIEDLQKQIDNAKTPFEREQLQNRLAKMVGGVSIIHVGGFTETEMKEKKDRVDDALNATKAAVEEGIVPGGGSALLYAREAITYTKEDKESSVHLGKNIVYKACGKPFEQILKNAGKNDSEIYPIQSEIGKQGEIGTKPWFGFNIKKESIVNMKEAGIIDPAKVTRTALENAAAVAGSILITECVIVQHPEVKNQSPEMPMY